MNVSSATVVNVTTRGVLSRALRPGLLASDAPIVTNRLFDRLGALDITEVERRIEASGEYEHLPWRVGNDVSYRRFLLLTLGLWLEVPAGGRAQNWLAAENSRPMKFTR